MLAKKTLGDVGKKNLTNITWKIDSTNASQKIVMADISWQIFSTYFDNKKILFNVYQKIILVDVGLKISLVMVRQNNPN